MTVENINEIRKLTRNELEQEILFIKQELLNLRLKKATRQNFQPHLFKHYRRRLVQLLTIDTENNK